jgi:hypothetical protein
LPSERARICFWGRDFFNARSEFFALATRLSLSGAFSLLAPDPRSYFYLFCAERMQIHLLKSASREKDKRIPEAHARRQLSGGRFNRIQGNQRGRRKNKSTLTTDL